MRNYLLDQHRTLSKNEKCCIHCRKLSMPWNKYIYSHFIKFPRTCNFFKFIIFINKLSVKCLSINLILLECVHTMDNRCVMMTFLNSAQEVINVTVVACMFACEQLPVTILHQSSPNFNTMFVYIRNRTHRIFGYLGQRSTGDVGQSSKIESFTVQAALRHTVLLSWPKLSVTGQPIEG